MNEAPFISLPIYTAATTTAPPPPTMSEPITDSPTVAATVNAGPKRKKTPQPPLVIPAGCICFRLLCHASRIGGVIGKFGSVIKQLQQDTSAKIRVEDPLLGSDDRVISVVASCCVDRTMSFDEETSHANNGFMVESSEYTEVSAAQEALVRVYERVLNVAAETDGTYFAPGVVVSCRLLTDTSLVGSVIGKGGKVIQKIRNETGCKIRIFSQGKLPSCAMPTDEMVEIEGDISTIKKALLATSRRLQERTPSDQPRTYFGRPQNSVPCETISSNGHMGFAPSRTRVQGHAPTTSTNHTFEKRPFASRNAETAPYVDLKNSQEIVLRILCSGDRVGGIIGKSGSIIRALQKESGASIFVEDATSNYPEKIITITAMESPESRNSPAQNAVILVFNRSVETGYEKGFDSPLSRTPISAKLLIQHSQVGCLLGKCGSIIEDMRKVTGAYIKIVGGPYVPRGASKTDEVVLITGEFINVRDALYSVTSRLRNYLFSKGNSGKENGHHLKNEQSTLTQNMDDLQLFSNGDHPSSSQVGGGNPINSAIELGGFVKGSRSAMVRNTTVEIVVPENVIGSVYGENGSNLNRLRQISGAKVVLHEPDPGMSDYIVVISGTPDETLSAQNLLEGFILDGQQ